MSLHQRADRTVAATVIYPGAHESDAPPVRQTRTVLVRAALEVGLVLVLFKSPSMDR